MKDMLKANDVKNQVLSPVSPFPEQPSLQSLVQAQESLCLRGCQVRSLPSLVIGEAGLAQTG